MKKTLVGEGRYHEAGAAQQELQGEGVVVSAITGELDEVVDHDGGADHHGLAHLDPIDTLRNQLAHVQAQ